MKYMNVGEHWVLYDTVMIGQTQGDLVNEQGWFANLALLAASNNLFFFKNRTRASGLAYNNLDVRDQMPYGFRIFSGGCTFWASSMTEAKGPDDGIDWWAEDAVSHIFMADLPYHCSYILQVAQDELLKAPVPMVPAGYGPSGGGVGRGSVRSQFAAAVDKTFNAVANSSPHITNRWEFPEPLDIPRNAALSVELNFAEYGKELLKKMVKSDFQDAVTGNGHASHEGHDSKSYYGIQCTLLGERLVQQRGALHR